MVWSSPEALLDYVLQDFGRPASVQAGQNGLQLEPRDHGASFFVHFGIPLLTYRKFISSKSTSVSQTRDTVIFGFGPEMGNKTQKWAKRLIRDV